MTVLKSISYYPYMSGTSAGVISNKKHIHIYDAEKQTGNEARPHFPIENMSSAS
jgi:hypothetical protein